MREDKSIVHELIIATSENIGRCAFEMTQAGSCPDPQRCQFPHTSKPKTVDPAKPTQSKGSRICFKELRVKDSCGRGMRCKFSHTITQEQRNDPEFVNKIKAEKEDRASKCVFEFRGSGACLKGKDCPFSHKISNEDRNNTDLKKKVDERMKVMKNSSTKDGAPNGVTSKFVKENGLEGNDVSIEKNMLEEMKSMFKEFKELLQKQGSEASK